jgi:poly-gamma-glutamate synthesis protein (capsule biosynthesis protein)
LFLCGDVMTGRGVDQILPDPCDPRLHECHVQSAIDYLELAEQSAGPIPRAVDFSYVWGAALEELSHARPDARIINLETSVTHSDAWLDKGINYRMSPENAACLRAAGVDCCVLANNHVLDWGRAGLVDTLNTLEALGIKTAGAGRDRTEASKPAVLDITGKGRVIIQAFGLPTSGIPRGWAAKEGAPGVNVLSDLSAESVVLVRRQLEGIRRLGDVVVVSFHWGPNWGYAIPESQRRFAHDLIDAADVSIVHGHSSHHAKAIEVYKDRLILYGCGDFLNDYEGIEGREEFRGDLGVMYFASVDSETGDLVELHLTPLQIRRFQPVRAMPEDVAWLQQTLARESRDFGVDVEPTAEGRLVVSWRQTGANSTSATGGEPGHEAGARRRSSISARSAGAMMQDWNVVVTVFQGGFKRAVRALHELGRVERSAYHNVLVMAVENPLELLDAIERRSTDDPALYDAISRVAPASRCFDFETASEFCERAKAIALEWLPRLANRTFHVRVHGRGLGRYLHTQDAERIIDDALLGALETLGARGVLSFSDPDAIIVVDSVDDRAGLALWTRDDLKRHPLLRPD